MHVVKATFLLEPPENFGYVLVKWSDGRESEVNFDYKGIFLEQGFFVTEFRNVPEQFIVYEGGQRISFPYLVPDAKAAAVIHAKFGGYLDGRSQRPANGEVLYQANH